MAPPHAVKAEKPSKKRARETTPSLDEDNSGARQGSPKRPRNRYNKGNSNNKDFSAKTGPSVNELKTKLRDAKRLLARDKIPADVRIEKERAILGYERDLENAQSKKTRSNIIGKYHFVRFMERKKATRALKYLVTEKSKLEEDGSAASLQRLSKLEKQIFTAHVDVNYPKYSPLTEKYVSLFPSDKGKKEKKEEDMNEEELEARRKMLLKASASKEKPPLWHAVKKSMEEGTLDLLREGRLGIGHDGKVTNSGNAHGVPVWENKEKTDAGAKKRKTDEGRDSKKKKEARKTTASSETKRSDDEGDGGGFFEI